MYFIVECVPIILTTHTIYLILIIRGMNYAEKNIRELRENHLGRRKWSQTVLGQKLSILTNLPNGLRQKQIALFETGYYREKNPKQFQEYLKALAKFLSIHFTNMHHRMKNPIGSERAYDELKSERVWISSEDLETLDIEALLAKTTTITADFTINQRSFSKNGKDTFGFSLENHSSNFLVQEWTIGKDFRSTDLHPEVHLPLGQHHITLTVTDRHNRGKRTISKKIKVSDKGVIEIIRPVSSADGLAPEVSFETADPENNPPRMVHFINNAAPEFSHFEWSFGDGFVSHEKCPQHVFEKPGIYQVTLVARNQVHSSTAAKPILVPSADFEVSRNGAWVSRSVQFVNNSKNALYHSWDYDDDTNSQEKVADHTYKKMGTYHIKLVTSSNDARDELIKTIKLRNDLLFLIFFVAGALIIYWLGLSVINQHFRVYDGPMANIQLAKKSDINEGKIIPVTVTRLNKKSEDRIYTLVVQRSDSTYVDNSWPKNEKPIPFEESRWSKRGTWSGVIIEAPNPNDPYFDDFALSVYCVTPTEWTIIQEWYTHCTTTGKFPPMEVWFRENYIKKGRDTPYPLRPHNRIHESLTEIAAKPED